MSEPREYENFDLLVERRGRGFRASVFGAPGGEGRSIFRPPYSDDELQEILARLAAVTHRDLRPAESPRETAEAVGRRLFEALFSGEVGALWRESRAQVQAEGKGLRLRLRFPDASRFESWPWELLFDPTRRRFVAQSVRTPLVRYLTLPVTPGPPPAEPPLRMLVVAARPSGFPPLDEEREWSRLQQALSGWVERGWLVLERLDRATLEDLQQDLRKPCHILHIVSHGQFAGKEGALVLEDKDGRPQTVTGVRLGAILAAQSELRLVVLNACEGALTSIADPLAGIAQALAGSRIPAVVAMRSRITDEAAVAFAQRFYEALGRNFPVDVALAEARRAMLSRKDDLEWTAPVLYTRSPDCRLFRFPEPVSPEKKARVPGPAWVAAAALSIVGALVGSLYPFMNQAAPKAEPADPNLTYVAQNPPECPSPPDIPMAFVKVSAAQPFCIGRFEVTQAQWKKIMGSNPSDHRGDALPVERVLWEEAQEFLTRLNGRRPGANFRLPTNAQWEYAAGAGTTGPSSFKGNPEDLSRYGNCGGKGNRGGTIPVGSLAPNPWGIFDMYGNVAELVADEPSASPAGAPPVKHVRRGGGFRNVPASCDSVSRSLIQSHHYSDTGFRIIRDLQR